MLDIFSIFLYPMKYNVHNVHSPFKLSYTVSGTQQILNTLYFEKGQVRETVAGWAVPILN